MPPPPLTVSLPPPPISTSLVLAPVSVLAAVPAITNAAEVVACAPPVPVSVALTVMVSEPVNELGGTVILRPLSWSGVRLQLPSAFLVPADSVAAPGMPVILSDSVSDGLVSDAEMLSGMAAARSPAVTSKVSDGAETAVPIATVMLAEADAVEPSVSVAVAVAVRWSTPVVAAARLKFASCVGVRLQLPSAFFVPADKVAFAGTPSILIASVSVPSVEVSADEIASAIAEPAVPEASCTVSVGATAPATSTVKLPATARQACEPRLAACPGVR